MNKLLFSLAAGLLVASAATAQRACETYTYTGATPCSDFSAVGDWAPNGETARIAFSALGAPPNTAILFLVAGYPADVPLWPLGNPCSLLVDNPPFSQLHQTDSNGDYTFSKAIGGIPPFMVHVQFLSVEFVDNQFVIGVSNGIHMSCQ